ncbi:hypothetical protein [Streptomyces ureilyticus]|uniref:Uncharacterized protein n=1 Tax=Streptomyces ureilyticus TaxID=1775131 RepID=A0ABX0DJK9_9ACTN|nr:hypothetical protein [Streptomyces ureilyticus]NGO42040.1 hypothetical protein [Streptomyces ureilyticus]
MLGAEDEHRNLAEFRPEGTAGRQRAVQVLAPIAKITAWEFSESDREPSTIDLVGTSLT